MCQPIYSLSEHRKCKSFVAARGRFEVVCPLCLWWEAHQNRLNATIRFQSEFSSCIINKVELHVSPPTQILPLLLLIGKWLMPIPIDQFRIDRHKGIAQGTRKLKYSRPGHAGFIGTKPVIKHAAYATGLLPVFDIEIPVCMGLEVGIESRAIPVADRLKGFMEVSRIVLLHIMWGKVYASAKPPDFVVQFEVPYIHVNDGYKWVVRMDNNRYTRGKKLLIVHLKCLSYRFGQNPMYG